MRIIIPATPLNKLILGKQTRSDDQCYRLMTYVVQCHVADGLLLYNTLTCSLLLLTPDEAADITAQKELIDRWFLVPQEHDDQKFCRKTRQMAALLKPTAMAIVSYTILPTTGCNARCFYCYEKGTKPVTMTAETAGKVVRYILAHRGDEKVELHWFGGEPLVNVSAIDQICTELNEKGVPFYSNITSNGYLFDADMVQRAKDLWQLNHVQITLDGMAQTYNRVKDYLYKGVNAFECVLTNIGLLITAGIRVSIRLNVDMHNMGEMSQLVSLLHQRFGPDEHLSVYSRELFSEYTPEERSTLYSQRMQLQQQIEACGYRRKRKLQNGIKQSRCMADNDQSVLISPDGHLGKCEHFIDCEFFGHIDHEERDKANIRKFKQRPADIGACATCFYYPQCYRLVTCPVYKPCTPEERKEHLYDMTERMKYEYECYLSVQPV